MQEQPTLHGTAADLHMLGIVPGRPHTDLNLAGAQGTPEVAMLARTVPGAETIPPTFSAPTMQTPALAAHDLTGAGIDLRPSLTPDPLLPDLAEYEHPMGIQFPTATPLTSDQSMIGTSLAGQPADMTTVVDALMPDPLLPDLQHPTLIPEVQMQDRPGDLDSAALAMMHMDLSYQQLADKTYPAVFMDQSGMNDTRVRHLDLLMRGLDDEVDW